MFILFDDTLLNADMISKISKDDIGNAKNHPLESSPFVIKIHINDFIDGEYFYENFETRESRDFRWLALMGELNKR